jgi:hypothetical protein
MGIVFGRASFRFVNGRLIEPLDEARGGWSPSLATGSTLARRP